MANKIKYVHFYAIHYMYDNNKHEEGVMPLQIPKGEDGGLLYRMGHHKPSERLYLDDGSLYDSLGRKIILDIEPIKQNKYFEMKNKMLGGN